MQRAFGPLASQRPVALTHPPSLPSLTRQSMPLPKELLAKKMDARVISAFTRVFDALLPAHDEWD